MATRVLILAAGIGSGHNSAAAAVEDALVASGADVEIRRVDALDTTNEVFNKLYDDAYFALVSQVPWLVSWGYDNQDPPFKLVPFVKWWEKLNTTALVRGIREYDPQVVICTHFMPARLVSLMLARRQLDASLSVVTTDYDFQGLWLASPFTHYFVARDETRAYLTSIGVPDDRVTATGIPVRPQFAEALDAAAVNREFGLDPSLPTILISAGAAGGSYTVEIVRQALRMHQRFQAVVVCGRNAELRSEIEGLTAGRDEFHVLGFTERMPDLMRIASLFVGKPGGLSASECMAAGLPMVIINPIPGQEVRNADYLLEEGAAVRCNYPTTVGFKLDSLLAAPDRIAAMAANARRVGRPQAAAQVATTALAQQCPPLWISREAQRSMMRTGEDGVSAVDLPAGRRLRTLVDITDGGSVAVITEDQLDSLGLISHSGVIELAKIGLRSMQWQPESFDMAMTGKWLLSGRDLRPVAVAEGFAGHVHEARAVRS